jgi:hypothetical protein
MYRGPDRKLNRWQGYDYRYPGLYFVTICIKNRQPYFGEIVGCEMKLNEIGEIVRKQWLWLQDNFPNIRLDEWIIMPNHLHGIIEINFDKLPIKNNDIVDKDGIIVGNGRDGKIFGNDSTVGNVLERSLRNRVNTKILPLYRIIGAFKTTSSKFIHQNGMMDFAWQKSFHDRVIRNEDELSNKRNYIISNPAKWAEDRNNPINI